jgi:hypothetical protein
MPFTIGFDVEKAQGMAQLPKAPMQVLQTERHKRSSENTREQT